MNSNKVRISQETRIELRRLAEDTGQSMQTVLEQALDSYRRDRFFAEVDRAYDAVWADPAARREELAERALFEGTLVDSLDDA